MIVRTHSTDLEVETLSLITHRTLQRCDRLPSFQPDGRISQRCARTRAVHCAARKTLASAIHHRVFLSKKLAKVVTVSESPCYSRPPSQRLCPCKPNVAAVRQ